MSGKRSFFYHWKMTWYRKTSRDRQAALIFNHPSSVK
jgi:hypothetical protein